MVQAAKEYEHLDEFDDLANKIVEKYPEIFYGVNLDEIRCVSITNKDSDWHGLVDKHKKLLVASALCAIPTGDNAEGKTNPLDYKDYKVMLRTFGVDYLDTDNVPDILGEDVQWKSI